MKDNLDSRRSHWITATLMTVLLMCLVSQDAMGQQPLQQTQMALQIIGTKVGTWRSATVFTHAIWNDMLFYGGGSGSGGGDPRHEIEIGVFHLGNGPRATGPDRVGFHDPGNPIITRAQFGLDLPGRGITPLSILEYDGTLYMFCTSRPKDGLDPCIVIITASVAEPLDWGNYCVIVDSSLSDCANNHGASAMINPDDSSEVLVYFAACSPPDEYRILLASVPIDRLLDRQSYKLLRSYDDPVLKRVGAKTNYPFVRYDAVDRIYELWYSGHSTANPNTRS